MPVGNYANINGLSMYYEVHGKGQPLVLIHGGGSTIETTFGRVLPLLLKRYMVIAVELQAHGRTSDRPAPETFEQDADDVSALLQHLKVAKANIFGFSNGGHTALELAIRHPEQVDKLIIASAFYKREGTSPGFFEWLQQATFKDMPQALKDEFLKVNPDPIALQNMHEKDLDRMLRFTNWSDADMQSIQAPSLILIGDKDTVLPEHAAQMARLIPNGQLAILPGGHGTYLEEVTDTGKKSNMPQITVALIEEFLNG